MSVKKKEKNYGPDILSKCQIHHIVPRHHYKSHNIAWESFDLEQNKVKVTFEDHIQAHEL